MLLSGYLYHRACKEAHWTNTSGRRGEILPASLPLNGSYCAWLQRASAEAGLSMELRRLLQAQEGVTRMLQNVEAFGAAGNRTLTLCCCNYAAQMDALEAHVRPWTLWKRPLGFAEISEHRSSTSHKARLHEIAAAVARRDLEPSLLQGFPCPRSPSRAR